MTGREGDGGGCGQYDGECLFDDDRNEDEYKEDKKNDDVEDGMGCTGNTTSQRISTAVLGRQANLKESSKSKELAS
jgi:hypothetical protein